MTSTASTSEADPNANVKNGLQTDDQPNTNTNNDTTEEKKEATTELEKKKSSSSYYLYKSTDKEQAEKFKPKKLDDTAAEQVAAQVQQAAKGSLWNTGATMEQFDFTEWMKERLTQLLQGYTFRNSSLVIKEVLNIEGRADIILTRGKYRPGWEIQFEAKWEGYIDRNYQPKEEDMVESLETDQKDKDKDKDKDKNKDNDDDKKKKKTNKHLIKGTLKMSEIEDANDEDEWTYEVSVSKGKAKQTLTAKKKVNADKDAIIDKINTLIKELKAKKK